MFYLSYLSILNFKRGYLIMLHKKLKEENKYGILMHIYGIWRASQVVLMVMNLSTSAEDVRDVGFIPGSGRSPGGGHGNPLQYSC